MGPRLWGVLREAGLRPVGMIGIQPHCGPDDPAAVALADGVLRAVAPLIERAGVAAVEEIGVEMFGQRLRDELQGDLAVLATPILLSAWGQPARVTLATSSVLCSASRAFIL